jgi:hypothetical protein
MSKKISKNEARYQNYPKGAQQCSRCSMFRKPDQCTAVVGWIDPKGWCKLWAAKSEE